jgi:hypothetical protein
VRFLTAAVGCAVVALVACGGAGSKTSNVPASKPPTTPASSPAQTGIAGQITKLGNGTLMVKESIGNVTVAYDPSTNVLQTAGATQSNILAGACVLVNGERNSGDVTANMVQIQFNMNGNCTPPPGVAPGGNGPGNAVSLRGKITSVTGNSFVVQPVTAGTAQVTVTVPPAALITRLDSATTNVFAVGQCVRGNGQPNGSGVVQARALVITLPGLHGCISGGSGSGS